MPYIETEKVAQMRKAIRLALPDYKISVTKRHHSGVDVKLLSGPIPAVENVNVYYYKEHLKDRPDAVAVIRTILHEIFRVETPRTLVEDSDYGTVPTFYYDVEFGAWDKPYVFTEPTERSETELRTVVQSEFNQIRKTTACGVTTLGPDDSIKPCILTKGHDGFCDTGVR